MHSTGIHKVIDRTISVFRRMGFWHGEDRPTASQLGLKSFYFCYYALFPISFAVGIITNETADESIFLAEAGIIVVVLAVKVWMLLWKQQQIMGMLKRLCVFSIRTDEAFTFFNEKVDTFIKFVIVFACATIVGSCVCSTFPFIGNTKSLLMKIAFPLDYKNSEIGFWMAHLFFTTENLVTLLGLTFSVFIWYLLLHCSLRYKILCMEIRNLGGITGGASLKMTEKQRHIIFHQRLLATIEAHQHLREIIDELESFLSKLFLLQFATSALCICGSTYCLAFDVSDTFVERVIHIYAFFYNISDLFMITYFGNEIMLSSSYLSYSLFECKWIEQPHSTKKCMIFFGEYLKRSHEMLIGKLYPLTLETFTEILNMSYSLFNILKNTKH
ncbi:odorant receptor 2a-like [Bradysia coprophila]|uniref:odorant receptor 2a-like n=1 Tax=Bradysia coprophila TaxID=38358 RepID=UPI00187DCC65|nr:odorant receptor 2a-like [Bradysia coprophila]